MRKLLFVLFVLCSVSTFSQVKLTFVDGIENKSLASKMESKVSVLLSEINIAQSEGRALNFRNMSLSHKVQQSLSMLWENSPFLCTDSEIVESCVQTRSGYQVRNIPLLMKPKVADKFNERDYQEAVISFDRQGNIESFYLAINNNLYMNVVRSNRELTDLRRRQLILDYVEQFRTSYNTKDLDFLRQVFSEDALIIVGKVIKSKSNDGMFQSEKITYNKYSKQEYLRHLAVNFRRNEYIRVTFDEIEVKLHPTNTNFYGVTLHQGYTSSTYSDDGYIFLLWDFTDEEHPQIHVRTWQPDLLNGQKLDRVDVFSLSDFDI